MWIQNYFFNQNNKQRECPINAKHKWKIRRQKSLGSGGILGTISILKKYSLETQEGKYRKKNLLLENMEGNSAKKNSKHVILWIQTCNHASLSISAMYICVTLGM